MTRIHGMIIELTHAAVSASLLEVRKNRCEGWEEFTVEALINAASKAVGTRQVLRGLKAGTVQRVYVANDADTYLFQPVVRAAEDAGGPAVRGAAMKELGEKLGLDVACAAAAIAK